MTPSPAPWGVVMRWIESGRPDPRYGPAWLCTAMQTRIAEPRQRANERTAMHANRASGTQP